MTELPAPNPPEPELDPAQLPQKEARPVLLEGRALRKVYTQQDGSELPILEGVEIAVSPGEAVAIVGASGAGKSTLLHLLGGLDRATSGEVVLAGRSLFVLDDREL